MSGRQNKQVGLLQDSFDSARIGGLLLITAMKRDDSPDTPTNRNRPAVPFVKIVSACAVILFVLLNVLILRNASSFALSERMQLLIWFNLKPEFWPDWVAQALWMLATGAVLATILRWRFIQGWLESIAGKLFPFHISRIFRFGWFRKFASYPIERWILATFALCLQKAKQVLRPRRFPLFVMIMTSLGTGIFILAHFVVVTNPFTLENLHWLSISILQLPFLLVGRLIVFPLNELIQTGVVSWLLPIAMAIPFGLVMGGYLYGRKIKKFLSRDDIRPLLIRYSIIVAAVYIFFLPSRATISYYLYYSIYEWGIVGWSIYGWSIFGRVYQFYEYFIWTPVHLYWIEGIFSWRWVVFALGFLLVAGVPYYGFRYFYYASKRCQLSHETKQIFVISAFLFLYFFYVEVGFVLATLLEGMVIIDRYVLHLPVMAWQGICDAPCLFLYCNRVSWKLLIGPALSLVMVIGYVYNPFRRLAGCTGFSETIFYALLWTLLLGSCFSVIVWRMLLLLGAASLVYCAAVRDHGMPTIQIFLSPEGQKIAHRFLVGSLILFDLFIVLVCVYAIHQYCHEFLYSLFCMRLPTL